MGELFLKLVEMSVTASYIALAVILLRLPLKKAPKWITSLLWALVALRLVCPISIESALSLVPNTQPINETITYQNEEEQIPEYIRELPRLEPDYAPAVPTEYEAIAAAPIAPAAPPAPTAPSAPTAPAAPDKISASEILSYVWLGGAALMLGYALLSYIVLHNRIRASVRLSGNVRICDNIPSPFILGVFMPRIYLPSNLTEDDMKYVLSHENAHLRRGDHLWKPIGFLLLAVYWFNPIMWLSYVLMCRDIELACDEKVIKMLGEENKRSYSIALINCSSPRRMVSACPVAFGEVGVKERIKRVLSYKKPALWVILAALAAAAVVAVCFLTNPIDKAGGITIPENITAASAGLSGDRIKLLGGEVYAECTDNQLEEIISRLSGLKTGKKAADDVKIDPADIIVTIPAENPKYTIWGKSGGMAYISVQGEGTFELGDEDFINYLLTLEREVTDNKDDTAPTVDDTEVTSKDDGSADKDGSYYSVLGVYYIGGDGSLKSEQSALIDIKAAIPNGWDKYQYAGNREISINTGFEPDGSGNVKNIFIQRAVLTSELPENPEYYKNVTGYDLSPTHITEVLDESFDDNGIFKYSLHVKSQFLQMLSSKFGGDPAYELYYYLADFPIYDRNGSIVDTCTLVIQSNLDSEAAAEVVKQMDIGVTWQKGIPKSSDYELVEALVIDPKYVEKYNLVKSFMEEIGFGSAISPDSEIDFTKYTSEEKFIEYLNNYVEVKRLTSEGRSSYEVYRNITISQFYVTELNDCQLATLGYVYRNNADAGSFNSVHKAYFVLAEGENGLEIRDFVDSDKKDGRYYCPPDDPDFWKDSEKYNRVIEIQMSNIDRLNAGLAAVRASTWATAVGIPVYSPLYDPCLNALKYIYCCEEIVGTDTVEEWYSNELMKLPFNEREGSALYRCVHDLGITKEQLEAYLKRSGSSRSGLSQDIIDGLFSLSLEDFKVKFASPFALVCGNRVFSPYDVMCNTDEVLTACGKEKLKEYVETVLKPLISIMGGGDFERYYKNMVERVINIVSDDDIKAYIDTNLDDSELIFD